VRRPRIVLAVTSPLSALLLRGQLDVLHRAGADVTLISSPGARARDLAEREHANFVPVEIDREMNPRADVRTLVELKRVLSDLSPDIVNAGTPKAGLLVTLAAAAVRVPARIFTLRGMRSATMSGPAKYLVRAAEKVSCGLAHRVVCISHSLRDDAVRAGILRADKGIVLGAGSSNGIDVQYFQRTDATVVAAGALRECLGISSSAVVVSFVGRVHREKGILELAEAVTRMANPNVVLVVAGPVELDRDASAQLERQAANGHIRMLGLVEDVRAIYAMSDVVVLPSWREGFGNVVIEAGSMGVPVIAADVTGCRDSVASGQTGILVPPRDPDALARALRSYALDPELRRKHGEAGRRRAVASFANKMIWSAQLDLYNDMLGGPDVARLASADVDEG
jgi:glycosyltransferase involved in cell wall biosynthesis